MDTSIASTAFRENDWTQEKRMLRGWPWSLVDTAAMYGSLPVAPRTICFLHPIGVVS